MKLTTTITLALIASLLQSPAQTNAPALEEPPPKQEGLAIVPVIVFSICAVVAGVIIKGIAKVAHDAFPPETPPPPPPTFYPIWIPIPIPAPAAPPYVLMPMSVTTNSTHFWDVSTNGLVDPFGNPVKTYQVTIVMTSTNMVDWSEALKLEHWNSDFWSTSVTSKNGEPAQTNLLDTSTLSTSDHFTPAQLMDMRERQRFFKLK
jgi:hypothetical protein